MRVTRYRVDHFNAEEVLVYGNYGIKLVPYMDSKRCWWLRADNEVQQAEWMMVSLLCYLFC